MTRDDIIRMAREAGAGVALTLASNPGIACAEFRGGALERLAALVAAAEREECAKVCESVGGMSGDYWTDKCAEAIRARSNT